MDRAGLMAVRSHCPIPSRISPHAAAVQGWLDDWLGSFDELTGNPDLDLRLDRLRRANFAHYASRLYPEATPADLRTIAALFTWFFLLDDACDGPPGETAPDVRGLCTGVLHMLRHGPRRQYPAFSGLLRQMLVRAWRTPRERMGPAWRSRFLDAVRHHLDGILVEADNKAKNRRPTVTEYIHLRRATSAAYVSYTLVEFTTGTPLPATIHQHPLIMEITATGNDLLSWFNDLLSVDRDTVTSGGHNLVLAVARESQVPVEVASSMVVRRWQQTMDRFTKLQAAVPPFGPKIDRPLRHYLDSVAGSIRGTIDWSLESPRYASPGT
ncbi:terpene synthase family protein [Micromonospora sp. NPDC003197]